jgi:hypothetical protein
VSAVVLQCNLQTDDSLACHDAVYRAPFSNDTQISRNLLAMPSASKQSVVAANNIRISPATPRGDNYQSMAAMFVIQVQCLGAQNYLSHQLTQLLPQHTIAAGGVDLCDEDD